MYKLLPCYHTTWSGGLVYSSHGYCMSVMFDEQKQRAVNDKCFTAAFLLHSSIKAFLLCQWFFNFNMLECKAINSSGVRPRSYDSTNDLCPRLPPSLNNQHRSPRKLPSRLYNIWSAVKTELQRLPLNNILILNILSDDQTAKWQFNARTLLKILRGPVDANSDLSISTWLWFLTCAWISNQILFKTSYIKLSLYKASSY